MFCRAVCSHERRTLTCASSLATRTSAAKRSAVWRGWSVRACVPPPTTTAFLGRALFAALRETVQRLGGRLVTRDRWRSLGLAAARSNGSRGTDTAAAASCGGWAALSRLVVSEESSSSTTGCAAEASSWCSSPVVGDKSPRVPVHESP